MLLQVSSAVVEHAHRGNIPDAVPLHSERLGDINVSTFGGLSDLEGWRERVRSHFLSSCQSTYRPR